jgi:glutamate decarboxylase
MLYSRSLLVIFSDEKERSGLRCDRYLAEHGTSLPNAHPFYGGEVHSLQGRTGKTHAVC